jgi:hypothetical protein
MGKQPTQISNTATQENAPNAVAKILKEIFY